jgi:hypothetical protein
VAFCHSPEIIISSQNRKANLIAKVGDGAPTPHGFPGGRKQSQQSPAEVWGCVSAIDSQGRTIWIADAHRDDGKRFVAHADEKLTAFLELEKAISVCDLLSLTSRRFFQNWAA